MELMGYYPQESFSNTLRSKLFVISLSCESREDCYLVQYRLGMKHLIDGWITGLAASLPGLVLATSLMSYIDLTRSNPNFSRPTHQPPGQKPKPRRSPSG